MDLSPLSRHMAIQVDGIIGMDVLSRYVARINCDEGVLQLFDPEAIPYDSKSALPLERVATGCPAIDVFVPGLGETARFMIDTGCVGGGSVDQPTIDAFAKRGLAEYTGINIMRATADGSPGVVRQLRCKPMNIGQFHLDSPMFITADENTLGIDWIARFNIVLDFPRSRIALSPSRRYGLPDRSDYSGVIIEENSQGHLVVARVVAGSTAARHGVRVGDELDAVNDRRVSELPRWELFRVMSMCDGGGVGLTLYRDKEIIQVLLP